MSDFRTTTRAWLQDNCPTSMRTPMPESETVWGGTGEQFVNPDSRIWLSNMADQGWTVPTWPKEYGGGGLSPEEAKVLSQELARIGARSPLQSFGIWMLGPVLLEFGTEAQKQKHLPQIARGEIRWCQGYSEPGAGSDLAGLQTRAVDKGDHYLINGSKVWTSYADMADWIFCLVRTEPQAPKHEGISFILFHMKSEGVSVKPIQLISGSSPFCQTFFDDVRADKENLIGELNKGWTIAKRLLQHERQMISGIGSNTALGGATTRIEDLAKICLGTVSETSPLGSNTPTTHKIADATLRDEIIHHNMNEAVFKHTLARAREESRSGNFNGALSSMFKYYGSEQNKRKFELLLKIMGTQALGWSGEQFSATEIQTTRQWLRSKANSIEGGTSEVQLNIIAKRVLGLPD